MSVKLIYKYFCKNPSHCRREALDGISGDDTALRRYIGRVVEYSGAAEELLNIDVSEHRPAIVLDHDLSIYEVFGGDNSDDNCVGCGADDIAKHDSSDVDSEDESVEDSEYEIAGDESMYDSADENSAADADPSDDEIAHTPAHAPAHEDYRPNIASSGEISSSPDDITLDDVVNSTELPSELTLDDILDN
jgi:hypothetical protein